MKINKMECPLMYNCQREVYTNDDGNNKCKYEEICDILAGDFDFANDDARNDATVAADCIQAGVTNAINLIRSIDDINIHTSHIDETPRSLKT